MFAAVVKMGILCLTVIGGGIFSSLVMSFTSDMDISVAKYMLWLFCKIDV